VPVPTNRGHSLPLRSFPWATEPKTQNNKVILIRAAFRSDQLRPRQPLQGRHASSELRTNRDQAPTSTRKGPVTKPRLPITIEVLQNLKQVWLTPPVTFDDKMLWAAACTGFFGFLRAGEFTVPSSQAYDPDVHLSLGDLAIDSREAPSLIRLTIKQPPSVRAWTSLLAAQNGQFVECGHSLSTLGSGRPPRGHYSGSNQEFLLHEHHWWPSCNKHSSKLG
jgi:hypothetical protein